MKVILIKDVPKLGRRHEIKEVSSGHALNLLIPRGLVIVPTPEAIKNLKVQMARVEGEMKVHEELLLKNLKDLDGMTITMSGKASDKGHLFASIHRDEVAIELAKQSHIQVNASSIELDHPIKELGEHKINVTAGSKKTSFKLVVVAGN